MCTKIVPEEEDRVEKFIGGLPDNIQGNVIIAEPTRLQDVVCISNNLMDQKLKGYAVKSAENKRRLDNNQKDNRVHQPLYTRQNVGGQSVARSYTAGNNEKRGYAGPLPYCYKCNLHHEGPCIVKCGKYNKVRHMNRDCMNVVAATATDVSLCSVTVSGRFVGLESVSIRRIQGVGYGILRFLGRIGLVSFVVFGECRHRYVVSSLMDMMYWLSE
ncbi:hypothetical protein Tco_1332906 [Tanacetum coccineum]